jgi:hypothetical protein
VNWPAYEELVRVHSVTSLVYSNLKRHFGNTIPAEILGRMKQHFISTTQSNLALLREILAIVQQLRSRHIECAVFKGLAINQQVYHDLSIRKSGDIDILVREKDYRHARQMFVSQGFIPTMSEQSELQCLQSGLWHEGKQSQIDLHWGIPPRQLLIDSDKIMDHVQEIALPGTSIPAFAREDMFIVMCVNAIKEFWNQLLYRYCDIHEFLQNHPELDGKRLARRARELGCHRATGIALAVTKELFNVALTTSMERSFPLSWSGNTIKEEILLQIFEKGPDEGGLLTSDGHRLYRFENILDYNTALIDKAPQRILYRYRRIIEPNATDRSSIPLPATLDFLYYLIRPVRLAIKHVFQILRKLTGLADNRHDQ